MSGPIRSAVMSRIRGTGTCPEGRVRVWHGLFGGVSGLPQTLVGIDYFHQAYCPANRFGTSVSRIGDVNGNVLAHLWVGASEYHEIRIDRMTRLHDDDSSNSSSPGPAEPAARSQRGWRDRHAGGRRADAMSGGGAVDRRRPGRSGGGRATLVTGPEGAQVSPIINCARIQVAINTRQPTLSKGLDGGVQVEDVPTAPVRIAVLDMGAGKDEPDVEIRSEKLVETGPHRHVREAAQRPGGRGCGRQGPETSDRRHQT